MTADAIQPPKDLDVLCLYVRELRIRYPGEPDSEISGDDIEVHEIDRQIEVQEGPNNCHLVELTLHVGVWKHIRLFELSITFGGVFWLEPGAEHGDRQLIVDCPKFLLPHVRELISTTAEFGSLHLHDFNDGYQPEMMDDVVGTQKSLIH
jgi:preprotein translocase subunit SecB